MEGERGDPYEEQLLAVFNSCLEKGQARLREEGLRRLCDKLELEERSGELISRLSEGKRTSVSFEMFRDGLLKLLGQPDADSQIIDGKDISQDSSRRFAPIKREVTNFSRTIRGHETNFSPGRLNGTTNGEIGHSELRVSSGGYATGPKEMLEEIFEKLDTDCDGLISFDEFALLFENEKYAHEQLPLDWGSGSSSDVIKIRDGRNVIDMLGPHQTGYAKVSTIVRMWEVAGVSDAAMLLSDLGFTSTEIRLTDLTTVLCEELKNLRDEPDNAVTSTHLSLLKGALTLYQEEVRCMNTLVEHLSGERDKLRIDVAEANERANLLAQEIDEHHVRLEKSRQDQLKQLELRHAEITRDLSIQCTSEREAHTAALKALDRQLQVVQHEEQQVRTKLANVLQENQILESEVEKLGDQITKLKGSNAQLLMQVQQLAAEHEEVDTSNDSQESEQIIQLVERIKRLQGEMASLRDENDELTAELELTKTRGKTGAAMGIDNVDEVGDERSDEFIEETKASSRVFGDEIAELECEERASESLRDLVVGQTEKSKLVKCVSRSDDAINLIDKNFNNLDAKSMAKNKITSLRDYPPRKDEATSPEIGKMDKDKSNGSSNVGQSVKSEESISESAKLRIEEQEAKHAIEKKQLSDRCVELERSLDLLRTEYEQCEDYWAAKLEEERQLFEQEQKISDDKFSELIAKMAEYEEQFSPGEKARNDGRLSPIEEKFNLEQQYTDLEDEYEEFKTQTEALLLLRANEIKDLREKLSKEKRTSPTSSDASTQISLDEIEHRNIPNDNFSSSTLPVVTTARPNTDSHGCSMAAVSHSPPARKLIHCGMSNHRVFDPRKLNKIAESTVSNSLYKIPSLKLRDCYCQQIEAYNLMEELCRVHKAELHSLYEKKLEIDGECLSLTKQKEDSLTKGLCQLENVTVLDRICSGENSEEPNCNLSINVLKALNERLQAQEKKRRNLKISLTHQQHRAERILEQTWQQHCQEVAALRFALHGTKEQLKKQVEINQDQSERLAKADILSTDLYVQNAHLMASIKRLEQHCQALALFRSESTSV